MKPDRSRYGYVPIAGTCPDSGKHQYQTRRDAKAMARKVSHLRGLHAYECTSCGYWHLGHLPQVVKRGSWSRDRLQTGD